MSPARYLEDFEVGQVYVTGSVVVDAARIKAFSAEFDPQPFHLDEAAAASSLFGGLAASGWLTAALTMRLLVDGELRIVGGLIGVGIDELRWPRPVRAGDTLRAECIVLDVRPSKSRPDRGILKVRTTTRNQDQETVQDAVFNMIAPRRPAPGPPAS